MENKIKCLRCGNEKVWKAGKLRGKQQYQCKECKKKFITERHYSKEFKQKAIATFYEGNSGSGSAVGRIMRTNKSTIYNWIKKAREKIQSSNCEEERAANGSQPVDVIEMDELFTYIKAKKTKLTQ